MKEKVMYVKLPKDAKCKKVIITKDSDGSDVVRIEYVEKNAYQSNELENACFQIPKPERLVGGTEVYQKEGIPYWFCKIKNGRDEFMHLYMEDLTENDLLYDANGQKRYWENGCKKEFKDNVLEALANKPKEGFRWIPVYEPSFDGNAGLEFVKEKKPFVGIKTYQWEEVLKEYSPKNGSEMASKTTYFLLLLRWLKDGIATLEQLIKNSRELGHYWDSENAKHALELTGERNFGGLSGFVSNTYKLVRTTEDGEVSRFLNCGAVYNCNSLDNPVSKVQKIRVAAETEKNYSAVGLLELKY